MRLVKCCLLVAPNSALPSLRLDPPGGPGGRVNLKLSNRNVICTATFDTRSFFSPASLVLHAPKRSGIR